MSAMRVSMLNLLLKYTFLFWTFFFSQIVGDARGPTFDHSARNEPAIPGFPVLISRFSASSYKGWSRV